MADEGAEGVGRAAGGAEAARVVEYKDRATWLEARRAGIGASDAAAVIGARPSPLAVFLDKLGLAEAQAETPAMAWGRKLEPLVAAQYAEETGRRVVDPGPFTIHQSRAAETPWLMATLDRVIVDDARGPGVLEIKTTHAAHREQWAEEPPLPFLVQVMHQMAVTGYTWGSLAVLIGGQEFLWVDVPRNEEFIQLLVTPRGALLGPGGGQGAAAAHVGGSAGAGPALPDQHGRDGRAAGCGAGLGRGARHGQARDRPVGSRSGTRRRRR